MKFKLIFTLFLLFLCCFCYFSLNNNSSHDCQSINFVIDKPYLLAVKELAKKESLEKIIQDNKGKLIYKQWESFVVDVPQRILRLREYKIEGKLNFLMEKKDGDLGELKLPFEQNIFIDKNSFNIETKLSEEQKNIKVYNKKIIITPLEEKIQINIKNELTITKMIPFFLNDFMDKKVIEFNKNDLELLKNNLINTIQSSPTVKFKL